MSKFLRTVAKSLNLFSKPVICGTFLNFSTVPAFKEEDLEKPKSALKLENIKEKWTHKYLLQQSRYWLIIVKYDQFDRLPATLYQS